MSKLILLLFLIFPFGQLFRIGIIPSVKLHLLDIVVFGVIAMFYAQNRSYSWPKFARPLVYFWMAAFFSLIMVSLEYELGQFFTGLLYFLRFFAYSSLYFVFESLIRKNIIRKNTLINSLQVVGVSFSIFGLIQYFYFSDARPLKEFGWDPHMHRLFGTFLDPAFVGMLIVFYLLLNISSVFVEKFSKVRLFHLVLGIIVLYLTYSRASYLAFLVALGVILISRGKKFVYVLFSVIFLVLLIFLPRLEGAGSRLERVSTIVARVENYRETIEVAVKSPLFGVGFNMYRYATQRNLDSHSGAGADSSLLFVFATTGVVGSLIYISFWFNILRSLWGVKKTFEGTLLLSSTVALLTHSIFSNTLFYPWVLVWFGVGMSLRIKANKLP